MEGLCYLCRNISGLTEEHVIPQALGGVLAADIACSRCNSECGHEIDAELARHFGRYATLLQIPRERGENQSFTLNTTSGLTLKFDGKTFRRKDPHVHIDKDESGALKGYEVIARSPEELRTIVQAIARKYNLDPNLGVVEYIENEPPESSHEFWLDSPAIHRAVARIAFSFLCVRLPDTLTSSFSFEGVRQFIRHGTGEPLAHSNFAHGKFMADGLRPLHKIHLSFNSKSRLVVGYVSLFGMFRYTVLLSDSFKSVIELPGVDYTYDPTTQREIPAKANFRAPSLSRDEVLNPKHTSAQVVAALQRGQNLLVDYSPALSEVLVEPIPRS